MDVRSEIVAQFEQVAEEQGKSLAALTDGLALYDSGLDSLCFAIVVVRLEMALDRDPFSSEQGTGFPVTFGDFVRAYEQSST